VALLLNQTYFLSFIHTNYLIICFDALGNLDTMLELAILQLEILTDLRGKQIARDSRSLRLNDHGYGTLDLSSITIMGAEHRL